MHNHGLPLDLVDVMTVEGCGNTGGAESKPDLLIQCEHGAIDMT